MFPITKTLSRTLQYRDGRDYVAGYCSDSVDLYINSWTEGLLSDIDQLELVRSTNGFDKIFAVVPGNYFVFHKQYKFDSRNQKIPPAGVVFPPYWKPAEYKDGLWNLWGLIKHFQHESDGINLGGSWNVAFIRDDQLNLGTVAHELAHTLGQGRELYDPKEYCRHFKGESWKKCYNQKIIPRFLHTGTKNNRSFWELSKKSKFTIMNNQGDIDDQWIDRDTYQKILRVSSKLGFIIDPWKNLYQEAVSPKSFKSKPATVKVIVSGFYYWDKKAFVSPKIKIRKTRLQTKSFYPRTENTKIPVVVFQLKDRGKILKQIKRLVFKTKMELLYKDRDSVQKDFPFSHAMAVFELPVDYRDRDLQIEVLGPWKDSIYKAFVPKKKRNPVPKKKPPNRFQPR